MRDGGYRLLFLLSVHLTPYCFIIGPICSPIPFSKALQINCITCITFCSYSFFITLIGVDFNDRGEIITHKGLKICTGQIQELVLGGLNQAVAGKLVSSVNILRDSYTGSVCKIVMVH